MKRPGLLIRIRSALREGWADPGSRYGSLFVGRYVLRGGQVMGTVWHYPRVFGRPPVSIVAERCGEAIGVTSKFMPGDDNVWSFTVHVGYDFSPADVLGDQLQVFALDRIGGRSKLQLKGAAQLNYIRATLVPPSATEVVIDFSQRGNSDEYVREGWYRPEAGLTWTAGVYSTIEIAVKERGERYRLEILAWPFVDLDRVPIQLLAVSVNGRLIGEFFMRPGSQPIVCDIPSDLTEAGNMVIRFDHPNAARPCDLPPGRDTRSLAVAFQNLTVRRLTGQI
jgi:hypothetical protein